ncbi:MAG: glutathione peroxidase [Anaerovoracaceae bacterium]
MNVYDFSVKTVDGKKKELADYKGKTLLIVNTASFCGYTKQLMGLEKLYQEYKEKGLEILAFPCNQFMKQEPDDIDTIEERYRNKYGVTFPIFDKIDVNGDDADPLFVYLKDEIGFDPDSNTPLVMLPLYKKMNKNYKESADIKWNFTKFLVDKTGKPRVRFEPEQTPSKLKADIEQLISE